MIVRRPRFAMIKRTVNSLLMESGVFGPAVPVEKIAEEAGIEVRYGDLGEISGLLARKPGITIIGVNVEQPNVRQRFTIAHELGHYLLHEGLGEHADRDYRINFRDSSSSEASNVLEIEANFFAANLLMPEEFLERDDAESAIEDDQGVADLAAKYDVSRHAMSLRIGKIYGHLRPF
ncbi:ImmA/IrrE family metallo-endopeptidase [Rhizobium leguminosarum]